MNYGNDTKTASPYVDARTTSQDMLLDTQRLENKLRGDEKLAEPLRQMKKSIEDFSRAAADAILEEKKNEKK